MQYRYTKSPTGIFISRCNVFMKFFVTGFYSHGSFYIEMYNILQTTTTLPYRTDEDQHEDQLDFEAEDSISAADTSSIVDEEC